MCQFTQKELEPILNKLKEKNWLNENFDNNGEFIKNICNLEFTSPKKEYVFNAFKIGENNEIIKPEDVRVLIIGQDPYPDEKYPNKADGLAFSQNGQKPAVDSLLNIFKAIKNYHENCNIKKSPIKEWDTNLGIWAKNNGVLLLNTALTYKSGEKHFNIWKPFVTQIICNLIKNKLDNDNSNKLVCFLWGVPAQQLFFELECYKSKLKKLLDEENFQKLNKGKLVKGTSISFYKNKLDIFMTSHPCNMSVRLGFEDDSPNHFKASDEFLFGEDEKQYIWKNFPENNKEKQK